MPCYPSIAGKSCLDPGTLVEHVDDQQLPLDFWQRCNSYECPRGPEPGKAHFLLLRKDLDAINKNTFVEAIFRSDQATVTIPKLLFSKATCMSAGISPTDQDAAYWAEFVDSRHVLDMSTIGSGTAGEGQYNVRCQAVEGATSTDLYYSESLNGGSLWTWQTMLDNLWGKLPSTPAGSAPVLPYTPDGSPEGFRFIGVSAWQAIHEVLEKISCTTTYDPLQNLYGYIKLGSSQSSLSDQFARLADRLLYSYWPVEDIAASVPATIRVFFHRYDEHFGTTVDTPRTGSAIMDPVYSVDKATGASGAIAGTVVSLWDDLPALYDLSGTLTNSAALSTRATEVAANLVLAMTTGVARMRRMYSGCVDTILPGAEISRVIWRDYGDAQGMVTEMMNRPDEPMDQPAPDWISGQQRRAAERLMPPDMGRATLVDHPRELLGKLDDELTADGTATVSIWRWTGSAFADTGVDIEDVADWLIGGASSISAGKRVIIRWFPDSGLWVVVAAECE
mgnify:CR=1 FL=1